jgi:hypothetical protein
MRWLLILGGYFMSYKPNKFARRAALVLSAGFVSLSALPAHAGPRAPAEAYAALPTFSDIALSPDGKKIAYSMPRQDGNLDVIVYDLTTRQAGSIGLESSKVRGLTFEEGGQILVTASATSDAYETKVELFRVFAVDLEKRKARLLLSNGGVMRINNTGVSLDSILPDQPNSVMMSTYDAIDLGSAATWNLYQVSLTSNAVEVKARGTPSTYDWLTDRQGNAIARTDHNLTARTTTLWIKNATGQWREMLKMEDTATRALSLLGQTASGNILFTRDDGTEFGILESINPVTGQVAVALKADGIELTSIFIDSHTQRLNGVRVGGLEPDIRWIDRDIQTAQVTLEARYPGEVVSIISYTPDHKKFMPISIAQMRLPNMCF